MLYDYSYTSLYITEVINLNKKKKKMMDTVINISRDDFEYELTLVYKNITSTIDIMIDLIRDELENSHLRINGFNGRSRLYYDKCQTLRIYHNTSITISNMLLDSDVYHNYINREVIEI